MKWLAPVLALLLFASAAIAQEETYYRVPAGHLDVAAEAVTIRGAKSEDTFIPGLGWLSGNPAPAPLLRDGTYYLTEENVERFGLIGLSRATDIPPAEPITPLDRQTEQWMSPLTANVRFGGDVEIRVVVDLPDLVDASELQGLERQGMLDEGEVLSLPLPRVPLPPGQADPYRGIDVSLLETRTGVRFELTGPELSYRVFTLEEPTRLVVDVVPISRERIDARSRELLEGVTYRTFGAPTPVGQTEVHLLEIERGAGEFKVVGTSEVPRTLSELADGGFAAINAGYFNTRTFEAIGLLRVDYGLQSLPSRNRASIGFGLAGPVMNRVKAHVDVRVNGRLYRRESPVSGDGVQVHSVPGRVVGSPRKGALVSSGGRIIANRIGPVTVPEDGFVVVYPPDDRQLALIDPGAAAGVEVDFEPDAFQSVRYAVEAGPLLVSDGLPAFEPDREQFTRGERILDAYTQQSAIGIRADGTVLLLVAEAMRAEDLVPLFLSLGAEHAMRLDSGSSATLLAGGQVLNRARQRQIVSAIVFVPGHGEASLPPEHE